MNKERHIVYIEWEGHAGWTRTNQLDGISLRNINRCLRMIVRKYDSIYITSYQLYI